MFPLRVVVFGSTGFIGKALCGFLLAHGHEVFEVSSRAGHFDGVTGRLSCKVPRRVDVGVFLAQSPYWKDGNLNLRHLWGVNVGAAIDAATEVLSAGGKRFIYASSGSVYHSSFEPLKETSRLCRNQAYALSKIHGEESLSLPPIGLETTAVRLFTVYGRGQADRFFPRLVSTVTSGEPVKLQPRTEGAKDPLGMRLSMCHVRDVCAVIEQLIPVIGVPVVNVASPEVTSVGQLAGAIGERLGRRPSFENVSTPRIGDLVADCSELARVVQHEFLSIEDGIALSLDGPNDDLEVWPGAHGQAAARNGGTSRSPSARR